MTENLRVVVVGHGMAGARLVDDLLARGATDPSGRPMSITVVGGEPYGAYNRILLSDVVAGRADVATLSLSDTEALAAAGVDLRLGRHGVALDLAAQELTLDDGATLGYDRLVLATGSRPLIPPLAGLDMQAPPAGVHAFRTLDDCREIVAASANAKGAVVLGGGLLGLEAARGLGRRGVGVELLHAAGHLMERQLDPAGGAVLARQVRRLGVQVRTNMLVGEVLTENGRLVGVVAGDEVIPTELLVIACGVRAETTLAEVGGLHVVRGVVIDETLTTSDPAVSAIGDCAEYQGDVGGLVAPAWEQARVVADLLTGRDPGARYHGHRAVTRLKAADLDVAAAGETHVDLWETGDRLDVVQLADPASGRYVKAVIRDGVVTGAVCVGEPRAAAELTLLVERGSPAPRDRSTLLLPGARVAAAGPEDPTLIPDRATICRCNGVTKGDLVGAWRDGARTAEGMAARTRATTGCGTCKDAVCGLVDWLRAADPDTEPAMGVPVPAPASPAPADGTVPPNLPVLAGHGSATPASKGAQA
jgi:assimilatory nitrate reductase electron transfer subunit